MIRPVTVVVPVYADWPSLKDCIESLKQCVNTKVHKVMLVNDNGPDADELESKIKSAIKASEGFDYYRNSKNLGFLRTCNRAALELDQSKNDILLLNSDTKVTPGFLEELSAVLNADPKHGAVSPRTNNATIATVPISAIAQKGIDPDKSYAVFQKLRTRLPRYSEVPTAHGFCMLIKRSVIKKYGLFDEVFGKGYGEEVDFCQRIKKDGYRCLLANRAFVYHLEARSFTHETKAKLIQNASRIINERFPEYSMSVRQYIKEAQVREASLTERLSGFSSKVLRKIKGRR